jgi:hypothetical protein
VARVLGGADEPLGEVDGLGSDLDDLIEAAAGHA